MNQSSGPGKPTHKGLGVDRLGDLMVFSLSPKQGVSMKHALTKCYVWKACWRGTALTFKLEAKNDDEALAKAERLLKKMEGGDKCMDLKLMEVR